MNLHAARRLFVAIVVAQTAFLLPGARAATLQNRSGEVRSSQSKRTIAAPNKTKSSTIAAKTVDGKALAIAVRAAATPLAERAVARLAAPVCPVGVPAKDGSVAQCIASFDATPIAFLVRVGLDSSLQVEPTFPIHARTDIEAQLAGVRCGNARVFQVPDGATIDCVRATATVAVRLRADGTASLD